MQYVFTNKEELNEFLLENGVKKIKDFLNTYNIKFKKNEYAINSTYSNYNGVFKLVTYWYAVNQGIQEISKQKFIEALKTILDSSDFTVWLETKQPVMKVIQGNKPATIQDRIEKLQKKDKKLATHITTKFVMGFTNQADKYLKALGY